jgi:glycosyltransferase involved in cell wall biosynthesis
VTLSPPTTITPWRASWGRCLAAADEVRCFSGSTRSLILRGHPRLDPARVTVVPHRVDFHPSRLPRLRHSDPLVIGVLGHISEQKGALIVKDVVSLIERELPASRLVVIGTLDLASTSKHLEVTGPYTRERLVDLIESHGINMILFPSICTETFSYVIEEAICCGCRSLPSTSRSARAFARLQPRAPVRRRRRRRRVQSHARIPRRARLPEAAAADAAPHV